MGKEEEGRFTQAQQVQALKEFREGKTNVMIATSVAEEGMDIPVCSLVIRLEFPDTLIQLIQSRGRARYPDSDYVVPCLTQKETKNIAGVQNTEDAMTKLLDLVMNAQGEYLEYSDASPVAQSQRQVIFNAI